MTCCQASDRCPLGYLFYIHIGLADFLGFKILNFNIFFIFFFLENMTIFWGLEIFVDIFCVTSKLDIFYELFLQIKCSCMCSVMKSILIYT